MSNVVQTPMSKLARYFSDLHIQLRVGTPDLKIHDWNNSKPKSTSYSRYGYSKKEKKGVKSHFIRVYQFKDIQKTFAFAFSFLNEDRPQEVLAITLDKSENEDGVFVSSSPMLVEEIQPLLTKFILAIGAPNTDFDNYDGNAVINKFEEIFLSGTLIQDCDQVKEAQSVFEETFKDETNKESSLKESLSSAESTLKKAKETYSDELKASPEHIEMMELERKLAIARTKVKKVQSELSVKHNLEEIEQGCADKSKEFNNFNYELSCKKSNYIKKLPWFLQDEIDYETFNDYC